MELLIAILLALNVSIQSGLTPQEIRDRYPSEVSHAQAIIDNNTYKVDPATGIIIVDEGGD